MAVFFGGIFRTKVYLEPSQTSVMELFWENSEQLKATIFKKMLPCRCLTEF